MLQTSLLTDRKSLGYNNICVAEIRDNAASGCGSAWLEHLVYVFVAQLDRATAF